jgi:hypothetical protein
MIFSKMKNKKYRCILKMLKKSFLFSRDESDMDDKPQINDDLAKTIGQVCVGNMRFFIRAI